MPLALGGYFLFREASHGHWLPAVAIAAVVLLLRFWPRILIWFQQRRSSR